MKTLRNLVRDLGQGALWAAGDALYQWGVVGFQASVHAGVPMLERMGVVGLVVTLLLSLLLLQVVVLVLVIALVIGGRRSLVPQRAHRRKKRKKGRGK